MRWFIIAMALQLCVIDYVAASEAAYVPNRRFMPLPPPKNNLNPDQAISKTPAKFFPLTQTRYPMPAGLRKNSIASEIVTKRRSGNDIGKNNINSELPENFNFKSGSGKKVNMSQEDAEQIISIFTATR